MVDQAGWIPDHGTQCDDRPALELYEPDFTIDPLTSRIGGGLIHRAPR